jgi:hypothetical protein
MVLKAWGDESGSAHDLDPGSYVFGAVITDGVDVEERARERLRKLLLPGQRKLHWRDESDKRKDKFIATLPELGLTGIVVTRVGPLDERIERRRRKCFEHFALALIRHNVWYLCLESRDPAGDVRDLAMANALRASQVIPAGFRLEHAAGSSDPLLWAADIACGAIVAARTGERRWLSQIERTIRSEVISTPR